MTNVLNRAASAALLIYIAVNFPWALLGYLAGAFGYAVYWYAGGWRRNI